MRRWRRGGRTGSLSGVEDELTRGEGSNQGANSPCLCCSFLHKPWPLLALSPQSALGRNGRAARYDPCYATLLLAYYLLCRSAALLLCYSATLLPTPVLHRRHPLCCSLSLPELPALARHSLFACRCWCWCLPDARPSSKLQAPSPPRPRAARMRRLVSRRACPQLLHTPHRMGCRTAE